MIHRPLPFYLVGISSRTWVVSNLLQLQSSLVGLPGLLLRHPLVPLQDGVDALGPDEDGDGVEPGHVQPLDGVG